MTPWRILTTEMRWEIDLDDDDDINVEKMIRESPQCHFLNHKTVDQ